MNVILDDQAIMPTKAHNTDAGYDLYIRQPFIMLPNDYILVNTGVHIEIPKGYYLRIESRSSMMSKGLFVPGGIIDSGYTGAIHVVLYNFSRRAAKIKAGDKIAQFVIQRYYDEEFKLVDEFKETERGDNGFGSTN